LKRAKGPHPQILIADRNYLTGKDFCKTWILISSQPSLPNTENNKLKQRKRYRKRAGIERNYNLFKTRLSSH